MTWLQQLQRAPKQLVAPAPAPAPAPDRVRAAGTGPIPVLPPARVITIPPRTDAAGTRAALTPVPASLAPARLLYVVTIPPIGGTNPLADVSDDLIADLVDHLAIDDGGDYFVQLGEAPDVRPADIAPAISNPDVRPSDTDAPALAPIVRLPDIEADFVISRDAFELMDGLELFARFGLDDAA